MARVTRSEAERTKQKILQAVTHCLLDPSIGFDKMTYTRLQEMTGLSRGGILNHFNKKADFLIALDHDFHLCLLSPLDFSSRDAFIHSFELALQQREFRTILILMIRHIAQGAPNIIAERTWLLMATKIKTELGETVLEEDLPRLLGKVCTLLLNEQQHFPSIAMTSQLLTSRLVPSEVE
ncbi:hypothetical protein A3K86_17750 [Photobacterium jeanii]|uniref:HTH tetR-type domain-containing protein n=1 Tax=Photobacterium jeanii TaxID=858640 RepID=A0A178K0H6_9GAMM|nr:hypothetical protein [Photobacterium jeanii]OAN10838.1 hypothetical protein A3K86_17750 [Photobacterium jeanii]PST90354.1 hypothetical protein C9I91_06845 [Photobacterium jeanii]